MAYSSATVILNVKVFLHINCMNQRISWEDKFSKLVKKQFPQTDPSQSHHNSVQAPPSNSWSNIKIILLCHKSLDQPSGLFPLEVPTNTFYTCLLSPIMSWPYQIFLLVMINRKIFGDIYPSLSSSTCSFLHRPVTPSHLDTSLFLNILFSNTLRLRSSLNVCH